MGTELQRKKHNWTQLIQKWQASGKSVKDFCCEARLHKSDFYRMRKKLATQDPKLVRISTPDSKALIQVQQPIILELCGKYRIEIRNGFSKETLLSLISVLESV